MISIQVSSLVWVSLFLNMFAAVVAATVNVLCELARRNAKDYLSLAPQLFHLLTSSSNNWMLIKIIKLVRTLELKTFKFLSFISFSLVLCLPMNHDWSRNSNRL